MAQLIAIGYDDENTALSKSGGTVLESSLSKDTERALHEVVHGAQTAKPVA